MQRFYAYIDNYSFSDCFTTNSFLAQSLMPNIRGNKTLSLSTENFIFITHKKLDAQSRHLGINDAITSWPVILQLDFDIDAYTDFRIIALKASDGDYILKECDIKEYSADTDAGCFVFGEIPFSAITGIFFETYDQLADSDKSVFPDFLWKSDLVKVIEENEFNEVLSFSKSDVDILNAAAINCDSLNEILLKKSKYKAAILQLINGTREWQINSYKTSFDKYLQDLFNLKTEDIKNILIQNNMPVEDLFFTSELENLALIPQETIAEGKNIKQDIYNAVVNCLITNNKSCEPDTVHNVLGCIQNSIKDIIEPEKFEAYCQLFDSIEKCYLNHTGFGVDKVCDFIDAVDGKNSIFTALLFVIKNPSEFDKFNLSLSMYQVDILTARRALVLWSFLNGLNGIPAIGYNRENSTLWYSVEVLVSILFTTEYQVKYKPLCECMYVTNTDILGIRIMSEKIVTYSEIYEYLCADHAHVTRALLKEIYNIAKSVDHKQFKNDPYCFYDVGPVGKEICDVLTQNDFKLSKGDIDFITKKVKELKKTPEVDYRKIYADWVLNETNFKKIWKMDEKNIKEFYIKRALV